MTFQVVGHSLDEAGKAHRAVTMTLGGDDGTGRWQTDWIERGDDGTAAWGNITVEYRF